MAARAGVRYRQGMAKRIVVGALLSLFTACGGRADEGTTIEGSVSSTLPPPSDTGGFAPPMPATSAGPERIAEGVGTPSALAVTSDRIVFTTRSTIVAGETVATGALFVRDKDVGPALMLAVDRQGASYDALATDDTTAYVAASDGRIVAVPFVGGATTTIADLEAPAVALAASGAHVFFADQAGRVGRVAKAGGKAENLVAGAGAVRGLDADEAAVYIATAKSGGAAARILRVSLEGGDRKVLTSGNEPCAMVRDGRRLFWTSPGAPDSHAVGTGAVMRLSLDEGEVTTVASGAFSACALAAGGNSLYFAASAGVGLMRASLAGGPPTMVTGAAGALAQRGAIAVDTQYVYWLTEAAVVRLLK